MTPTRTENMWRRRTTPLLAIAAALSFAHAGPSRADDSELSLLQPAPAIHPSPIDQNLSAGAVAWVLLEADLVKSAQRLEAHGWYSSDIYLVYLDCSGLPSRLTLTLIPDQEVSWRITLAVRGERPLEVGAFAGESSGFRVNDIQWADAGCPVTLDADFELEGTSGEYAEGRILWNLAPNEEEPDFLPLNEDEWSDALPGEVRVEFDEGLGIPLLPGQLPTIVDASEVRIAPSSSSTLGTGLTQMSPSAVTPTSDAAGANPESVTLGGESSATRIPLDSIRYSADPIPAPPEARRRIANDLASLSRSVEPPHAAPDPPRENALRAETGAGPALPRSSVETAHTLPPTHWFAAGVAAMFERAAELDAEENAEPGELELAPGFADSLAAFGEFFEVRNVESGLVSDAGDWSARVCSEGENASIPAWLEHVGQSLEPSIEIEGHP